MRRRDMRRRNMRRRDMRRGDMRRRYARARTREPGRRWPWLAVLGGIGLVALLWKEFPAMRRYYKIERM